MKRTEFIKSSIAGLSMFSISKLGAYSRLSSDKSISQEPKLIRNKDGIKQIVLGDHQTIKLESTDTNGLYTLIEQHNNPGMSIPKHVHEDEDEVFHVLEGRLEISIGEKVKVLSAGDVVFCPRKVPHSWKVVGDKKTKVMLSIFPAGLENMFYEMAQLPEGPPDLKVVSQICEKYNIRFV
ncbi:cupin domain-containing protein [uncultured Psychroserpens sp.]|uniref:cupin domain-containing protein n=1 Tax=uncultured Psychroserpens sp. TaxID=255436 RepID=UPI0026039A16|nr:cupin domain-containing protein [uncultured Psychroserpens sp.]